jgi:hypothetical protein
MSVLENTLVLKLQNLLHPNILKYSILQYFHKSKYSINTSKIPSSIAVLDIQNYRPIRPKLHSSSIYNWGCHISSHPPLRASPIAPLKPPKHHMGAGEENLAWSRLPNLNFDRCGQTFVRHIVETHRTGGKGGRGGTGYASKRCGPALSASGDLFFPHFDLPTSPTLSRSWPPHMENGAQ